MVSVFILFSPCFENGCCLSKGLKGREGTQGIVAFVFLCPFCRFTPPARCGIRENRASRRRDCGFPCLFSLAHFLSLLLPMQAVSLRFDKRHRTSDNGRFSKSAVLPKCGNVNVLPVSNVANPNLALGIGYWQHSSWPSTHDGGGVFVPCADAPRARPLATASRLALTRSGNPTPAARAHVLARFWSILCGGRRSWCGLCRCGFVKSVQDTGWNKSVPMAAWQ